MKFGDEEVRMESWTAAASVDTIREKNSSLCDDKDEITARELKDWQAHPECQRALADGHHLCDMARTWVSTGCPI